MVVMEQFGCSISVQTMRQALNFALAHKHWIVNDWKRVVFSNETKINRFTKGSSNKDSSPTLCIVEKITWKPTPIGE